VRFAAPGEGGARVPLTLRYLADAPWFEAVGPLALDQPLRPGGFWDKSFWDKSFWDKSTRETADRVILGLTGLAVIAWLTVGRMPRRTAPSARRGPADDPESAPAAGIDVLQADPSGSGWRGRVIDRHDGTPIAEVSIALERPGFESADRRVATLSGADGTFALAPTDVLPGDRLVAEGPLHARVTQAAPPQGEVRVILVARRRALVDRLVAWAARRGRPYDVRPEPTPGHVRRVAHAHEVAGGVIGSGGVSSAGVGQWAEAVERAAYSGAAIDAQKEAEVDRLAPADASRPSTRPGEREGA
jgi:hypothetical protein